MAVLRTKESAYHAGMLTEEAILKRLRKICLRLSGATETRTFGHPTFQVEQKTFVVLETYKGELGICFKVGNLLQDIFLKDLRFFRTPYIGKLGWVTLRVHAVNWAEVRELAKGSYQLVGSGKMRRRRRREDHKPSRSKHRSGRRPAA
jgi:predicted DNA-binding protein (MmcQ/YjbR family)